MGRLGPPVTASESSIPLAVSQSFAATPVPPALVTRDDAAIQGGPARRAKIWEFNTNLHCSIIGTCLSTGELRQLLRKVGIAPADSSDHELHRTAVSLAGRHDKATKLLNKTLDTRHRITINQFARAKTADELHSLWREATRRGEIPGAYWATLTHPAATRAIISDAFGEVHMLSHLVGAANRADIRRLCQLEEETAALRERLDRQQAAFREAVVTRDATIEELRQLLAQQIAAGSAPVDEHDPMLRQLLAERERRLAGEIRRNTILTARLTDTRAALAREHAAHASTERENATLRRELEAIEATLARSGEAETTTDATQPRLDGLTLLYVGGRTHQVAQLREIAGGAGAAFVHHDGGIEHHLNLLPGLASRADLVMFPVDCVSHPAARLAKQLCRQAGKRFIPLRSASATSLLAALQRPEVTVLAAGPG